MAKENTVILYGWVTDGGVHEHTIGYSPVSEIDVLTLRKSGMTDEMLLTGTERETIIPVISKGRFMRTKMKNIIKYEKGNNSYWGCFVMVKGTLCTDMEIREYKCPNCDAITEHIKTIEYVDPLEIWRVNADELATYTEALEILHKHVEISNMSLLYGTVSGDPEYYTGGVTELRFPLIARRKRRIYDDPAEKTADRPWIRSFGKANEGYAGNIHHYSGLYINGSLQGREFDDQVLYCEECESPFKISAKALESIPYAMKYQKYCGSDDEAEKLDGKLTYLPPDENTAILIGWIMAPPRIVTGDDGQPCAARFDMLVYRKRYDGDDPTHRGETIADKFRIRTDNRNIINYIATNLAAPQPKTANNGYMGYIVIVKGTLVSATEKMRCECENCNKSFLHTCALTEVDPIGVWRETLPVNRVDAAFILHGISEIGNMVWCHGTVTEEPSYEADETMAVCRFVLEVTRTRRIYGEKDIKDNIPVTVTGDAARDAVEAVHKGSVVFINGALRAVTYMDVEQECPHCGEEVLTPETSTEVIPYQIEYHTNCDIPESELVEECDYE